MIEREQFEAWHARQYVSTDPLEWDGDGYIDFDHNRAWKAWQAALTLKNAPVMMTEPKAWRTTEPAVCVPITEDSGVAELWREAGFDVIELFERP